MTAEATYHLYIDTGRNLGYATEITSDLVSAQWATGFLNPPIIDEPIAPPSECICVIDNSDGSWTLDDSGATYHSGNHIDAGMWFKLTAESSDASVTETDLFIGRLRRVEPQFTNFPHTLTLYISDLTLRSLDGAFFPRLEINRRVSYLIKRVLRAALFETVTKTIDLSDGLRLGRDPQIGRAWRLGDTIPVDPSAFYNIDTSKTRLAWYGDGFHPDRQLRGRQVIQDVVKLEMGGIFFWNGRTGKYRFRNRLYQYDAYQGTTYTFTSAEIKDARPVYLDDTIINKVYMQYEPRVVGPARDLVFESSSSYTIPYGRGSEIKVSWQDTTLKADAKRVLAEDVRKPERGVDITLNSESDGTGTDLSTDDGIELSYDWHDGYVVVTVDNLTEHNPCYVTYLRFYGQSLKAYERERIIAEDSTSIDDQGEYAVPVDISGIGTDWQAQGYADHLVLHNKDPEPFWEHVTILANTSNTTMQYALQREVGDSVRINETTRSQHDNHYTIVGEMHSIDARADLHEVTYTLKHFRHEIEYITIGTDSIGGSKYIQF